MTHSQFLPITFYQPLLQGWDSTRISVQGYKLDIYGRRILTGYGFTHLPMRAGHYTLEVPMWIPTGPPDVELEKFLLGVYVDEHSAILIIIIPIFLTTIFCDLFLLYMGFDAFKCTVDSF